MKSLTNVVFKNVKRKDIKNNVFLSKLSFLIVFLSLSGVMAYFSYKVTTELQLINQTYAFINILLLMNFIILFAKSIFESLNVLYFSKDLKILLRMPIASKDIIHAKFLNMITSEYQMEFIMLAIPMITYGICTNATFLFYIYMVIILFFLPIIPITIVSSIIAIIMRFTNKIKNKTKTLYITIILAIILIGIISMNFSSFSDNSYNDFQNTLLQVNGVAESIGNKFILIKPIMSSLLNYNNLEGIKNVIFYLLESVLCYLGSLFVISSIYLKGAIGTTIIGKVVKNRNKKVELKDFKQKRKIASYFLKELKTLIRAPIFNFQCFVMPVASSLIILATVSAFIELGQNMGVDIINQMSILLNNSIGQAAILAIGQIFLMLNFSSIIAISRDGINAKLMKYIPIELSKQYKLKMLLGISINMVSIFILASIHYFITNNILNTIIVFVNLFNLNLFGEKIKLLIDVKNPKIEWNNEYTMMKQNTNVMFELFYTLVVIAGIIVISNIIKGTEIFMFMMIFILICMNVFIDRCVLKKQDLELKRMQNK